MEIPDLKLWIENMKEPAVLIAFVIMLFALVGIALLKNGKLSAKQSERLIMFMLLSMFIISIVIITANFGLKFKKEKMTEAVSKPIIVQEPKGPQSPAIIAGGNAIVTYGPLLPQTESREKNILNTFENIRKKTITGVNIQTYVELVYDSYNEVNKYLANPIADTLSASLFVRTYDCYNDALKIWDKGSPASLLQNGVVSLYMEAERRFYSDTAPLLSKKWQECSDDLDQSIKSVEKTPN